MNNNTSAQNMRNISDTANSQHIEAVSRFMRAAKAFETSAPFAFSEIAAEIHSLFGKGDWQKIRTTYCLGKLEEMANELEKAITKISTSTVE